MGYSNSSPSVEELSRVVFLERQSSALTTLPCYGIIDVSATERLKPHSQRFSRIRKYFAIERLPYHLHKRWFFVAFSIFIQTPLTSIINYGIIKSVRNTKPKEI